MLFYYYIFQLFINLYNKFIKTLALCSTFYKKRWPCAQLFYIKDITKLQVSKSIARYSPLLKDI